LDIPLRCNPYIFWKIKEEKKKMVSFYPLEGHLEDSRKRRCQKILVTSARALKKGFWGLFPENTLAHTLGRQAGKKCPKNYGKGSRKVLYNGKK